MWFVTAFKDWKDLLLNYVQPVIMIGNIVLMSDSRRMFYLVHITLTVLSVSNVQKQEVVAASYDLGIVSKSAPRNAGLGPPRAAMPLADVQEVRVCTRAWCWDALHIVNSTWSGRVSSTWIVKFSSPVPKATNIGNVDVCSSLLFARLRVSMNLYLVRVVKLTRMLLFAFKLRLLVSVYSFGSITFLHLPLTLPCCP